MSQSETSTSEQRLLFRSRAEAKPAGGPNKLIELPAGKAVTMGAHGALAEFLGIDESVHGAHPSTLDYIVAATTACLVGTFSRALAARGIVVGDAELRAIGVGDVFVVDDVPVLRAIRVDYWLEVDSTPETRSRIERAHAVHHRGCAVSRSLVGAIAVSTDLHLV
jgi:organic hydroperoxide reductase OsmC/OhrA